MSVFTHTDKDGRVLYAVCAAIRMPNGEIVADTKCMHAKNATEAHTIYIRTLEPHLRDRANVMGVGPAVGVFIEETKDKKIIVTV